MEQSKIVRGICDTYRVRECTDGATNEKFLEVFKMTSVGVDDLYEEEYLCDIDGNINVPDEMILAEIDAQTE